MTLDLKNLSELTLVVPSYNRQEFILRLMNYWSGSGLKLIVMDGTIIKIDPSLLNKLLDNIQYIHCPTGIYDRLKISINFVNTKYVALAGDDEFYIPTALSKCIEELKENPELVACCGRSLAFYVENTVINGGVQYPELDNYIIEDNNANDRLLFHMKNYAPSLTYAVCLSELWKKSLTCITNKEYPFYAAFELQFEMLMSFAGKSKVIPELMWLRSINENIPTRGTDPSLFPEKIFSDWWINSEIKEKKLFVSSMALAFEKMNSGLNINYQDSVYEGCNAFRKFYEYHEKNNYKKLLKKIILKLLPNNILKIIRNYIKEKNRNKPSDSMLQAAKKLENSGVFVDLKQLIKIESIIKKFHQIN